MAEDDGGSVARLGDVHANAGGEVELSVCDVRHAVSVLCVWPQDSTQERFRAVAPYGVAGLLVA